LEIQRQIQSCERFPSFEKIEDNSTVFYFVVDEISSGELASDPQSVQDFERFMLYRPQVGGGSARRT
jgi:hypothetical protein